MAFKDLTRRIYDHTLNLASRKNALTWLFVISFIESSFFPIPPDIMIIPMVLATPKEAYKIAGVATVAQCPRRLFRLFHRRLRIRTDSTPPVGILRLYETIRRI